MATVDRTSTQKTSAFQAGRMFTIENTVSTVVATTLDVIKALVIPKGTYVTRVYAKIVTAADGGTSQTGDIGDTTDPNGWDNQIDLKATAGTETVSAAGTDAYHPTGKGRDMLDGKAYASEGEITVTVTLGGTVPTVGSLRVIALCTPYPLIGSY